MECVDDVAGLPSRCVSKLFAPIPLKSVGRISLGLLLTTLGLGARGSRQVTTFFLCARTTSPISRITNVSRSRNGPSSPPPSVPRPLYPSCARSLL